MNVAIRRLLHKSTALISWIDAKSDTRPLAILRIGLASVLLVQAIAIAPAVDVVYGRHGIVSWNFLKSAIPHRILNLADAPFPVDPEIVFQIYCAALTGVIIGFHTRIACLVAWTTHILLFGSNLLSVYGVDQIADVYLFYLVFFPTSAAYSIDRASRSASVEPSSAARLAMRVHLSQMIIIYVSSGFKKACGDQWWNGETIFRSLMRDDFHALRLVPVDYGFLAFHPSIARIAGWSTLIVELGFLFAILPRFRKPCAVAAILLHVGIAATLGLISFASLMIALNLPFLFDRTRRSQS